MSMTTNKQALLQRIEKALNDFTNGCASMHVPPLDTDVDMVLADCANALEAAEKRIAELEAREVKLPQRQEPTSSGHYGEGYLVPSDTGSALEYEDTVEELAAAGITVKGGSE